MTEKQLLSSFNKVANTDDGSEKEQHDSLAKTTGGVHTPHTPISCKDELMKAKFKINWDCCPNRSLDQPEESPTYSYKDIIEAKSLFDATGKRMKKKVAITIENGIYTGVVDCIKQTQNDGAPIYCVKWTNAPADLKIEWSEKEDAEDEGNILTQDKEYEFAVPLADPLSSGIRRLQHNYGMLDLHGWYPKVELKVGQTIGFYEACFTAGNSRGYRIARIQGIKLVKQDGEKEKFPLVLDPHLSVPFDHQIELPPRSQKKIDRKER